LKIEKLVAALFACATFSCASQPHGEGKHWSYTGDVGPAHWGNLEHEFAACKLGHIQSPIDIRGAKPADLPAIKFDYKPSPLKVIDNGHTVQVNYAPGSSIEVGGARYELLQFHFHKPSEERIDGKAHDMVIHLVHKGTDGKLAVVAVLLDRGGESPTLRAIWKGVPKEKDHEAMVPDVAVDAAALLPADHGYFTFEGSLTTPPCSEGVLWFVMKTPGQISVRELAAFGKLYAANARPTQPINGRAIQATR